MKSDETNQQLVSASMQGSWYYSGANSDVAAQLLRHFLHFKEILQLIQSVANLIAICPPANDEF
jgi:hypothetical protein